MSIPRAYLVTRNTFAGPFTVVATDDAVLAAAFAPNADQLVARMRATQPRELVEVDDLGEITRAIDAYVSGTDVTAIDDITVEQPGGPFMDRAFAAMRAIPAATTITYGELAKRADSPQAVRAAGQACARNLAALFVPCHRVVASTGDLHHYLYGLDVKRALLEHERVHV
jgi:methylated-DNA-[protein]-cysteine S-methyltransferase